MKKKEVIGNVVSIPIKNIIPNPDNEKIFNTEKTDALTESIKNLGFQGAIEVYALPDGKYEIISGHRRWKAAKKAGLKEIPAFVQEIDDDITKASKLILSNLNNRELTPVEKSRAIHYYIEKVLKGGAEYKGDAYQQCAKVFDISERHVINFLYLYDFIPELQELVNDNKVPFSGLLKVRNLSPEEQKEVADSLIKTIQEDFHGDAITKARTKRIVENIILKYHPEKHSSISDDNEDPNNIIDIMNGNGNNSIEDSDVDPDDSDAKPATGLPSAAEMVKSLIFGDISNNVSPSDDSNDIDKPSDKSFSSETVSDETKPKTENKSFDGDDIDNNDEFSDSEINTFNAPHVDKYEELSKTLSSEKYTKKRKKYQVLNERFDSLLNLPEFEKIGEADVRAFKIQLCSILKSILDILPS